MKSNQEVFALLYAQATIPAIAQKMDALLLSFFSA
jgi:hypothetical protein